MDAASPLLPAVPVQVSHEDTEVDVGELLHSNTSSLSSGLLFIKSRSIEERLALHTVVQPRWALNHSKAANSQYSYTVSGTVCRRKCGCLAQTKETDPPAHEHQPCDYRQEGKSICR